MHLKGIIWHNIVCVQNLTHLNFVCNFLNFRKKHSSDRALYTPFPHVIPSTPVIKIVFIMVEAYLSWVFLSIV